MKHALPTDATTTNPHQVMDPFPPLPTASKVRSNSTSGHLGLFFIGLTKLIYLTVWLLYLYCNVKCNKPVCLKLGLGWCRKACPPLPSIMREGGEKRRTLLAWLARFAQNRADWSSSLEWLTLGHRFDHPIKGVVWPANPPASAV